jgi:hypothetical protein
VRALARRPAFITYALGTSVAKALASDGSRFAKSKSRLMTILTDEIAILVVDPERAKASGAYARIETIQPRIP